MTLKEELEQKKAELDAAVQAGEESAAHVAELNETITSLKAENEKLQAEAEQAKAKHAEELAAETAKVEELAANKALEIAAQQGAQAATETAEDSAPTKSLEELWKEYANIKDGRERTKFYRENIEPKI